MSFIAEQSLVCVWNNLPNNLQTKDKNKSGSTAQNNTLQTIPPALSHY